jgi:stalled ribosome alternative rescue factor ArfA
MTQSGPRAASLEVTATISTEGAQEGFDRVMHLPAPFSVVRSGNIDIFRAQIEKTRSQRGSTSKRMRHAMKSRVENSTKGLTSQP